MFEGHEAMSNYYREDNIMRAGLHSVIPVETALRLHLVVLSSWLQGVILSSKNKCYFSYMSLWHAEKSTRSKITPLPGRKLLA
eukprot:1159158-Pelagomonas_calceolata.AAC.6